MTEDIIALIQKNESSFALHPGLLAAIVAVESSGNTNAVRFEKNWKYFALPEIYANPLGITVGTETQLQSFSWGLCQIMGSVARENGFNDALQRLCEPAIGLYYGAKYLAKISIHFKGDLNKTIAAYNGGYGAVKADGSFSNQSYVDKVLSHM